MVEKCAVATFYQVSQIDYTLQEILGHKFWQYNIQNAKILQLKSDFGIRRPASNSEVH